MAALILSSYATGPFYNGAGNRTGSAGTTATCSGNGCHASNSSSTLCSLLVQTDTGTIIAQYTPGTTYTVLVNGSADSSLTKFGFQVSCVKANETSTQAGNFSAGTDMHVSNFGTLQLVEHSMPLSGTASAGGNNYQASFSWTAPAAGTGDVEFFAMLNAVNDNTKETGDQPGTPMTLTLKEASSTSVASIPALHLSLYPNPACDALHLKLTGPDGICRVSVVSLTGSLALSQNVMINKGEATINTEGLMPGYYVLGVQTERGQGTTVFAKQ